MRAAFILTLLLYGCTSFPALEGAVSDTARAAAYPKLSPLAQPPSPDSAELADIEGRAAALRARAAILRRADIGTLQ